ncbi:TonB-dependent receptor plug domain-containing protein [Gallaecimonas xiamenensis]|uniref:TonB-dependent receptor n=1 Tax=Gallaecimonas xiamenensis 3-C-1 TaxID=745411 RepID=K2KJT8_9GAMM|nr:TonB-dependent receptor [Gallaecimonas xiamenensis]EKE77590.1 TonB-dependent receptor [Gallaecimonas xiamenensis 3-C-1]
MRYSLLTLALSSAVAAPLWAADDTETIEVVGSRIALRTATDSVAPVDIITGEELAATGMTETARALQFAAPSYNFPFSSVTDGSDAVRPATLRGMSPDHTLVLVNGKRRHGSALVHLSGTVGKGSSNADLNAIPVTAIKRIEILRDGASAQYGSDAIAGVINIVLKDADEGGSLNAQGGQTYQGDGEQWRLGWNQGLTFLDDGFVNLSFEAHHKNKTNRAGADPRQQYPTLPDGSPDPREASFDRKSHHVGDAEYDNLGLFINAAKPLGEDGKLYAFGGISNRETESGAFYRRALDSRNLTEVYPDGYLPKIAPEIRDQSLYLGYEFSLGEWQFDSSVGYGKNRFKYKLKDSLNTSLGADSPTSFYAGALSTTETNLNLDGSRYLPFFNDSDLVLALGAAWRKNEYQVEAGEPDSYFGSGSQGFMGFTPESAIKEDRHNLGLYLELENQLTDDFYWAAALRHEDYSDFGTNNSWKLAARYELTDSLAVRATANTGFRAPSVQQLYFTNISTLFNPDPNTGDLVPTESGTFNNLAPLTQALGVGKLQAEESQSYSLGLVYTGDNGLSVTLDAYQIKVDDRIVLSSSLNSKDATLPQNVRDLIAATGAESARFFINAVDTKTRGIDLVVTQDWDLGHYGFLKGNMAWGYNKSDIEDVHLPSILGGLESRLFDDIERTRMTDANPRHTGSFGLTHKLGDFQTTARVNYFGTYSIGYSSGPVKYDHQWVADLAVKYFATDNLALTLGAQNLFDNYPEKRPEDNNFNGIFVYPLTNSPFGFNGGYYYLEAEYRY